MREMQYLSPSSIATWNNNPDEFYLRYLADDRPPRDSQTAAMAVGSAFDAYVKSYLHEKLFGKDNDPRFDLRGLFEAQVEEHQRDWAWKRGKHVFDEYQSSGVLSDLMLLLVSAESDPRFEFEIQGVKHGYREGVEGKFGEVVLLGKPDVDFTVNGLHIVLDWKVNGYLSQRATSPAPFYIRMRSAGRTHHGQHKSCATSTLCGVEVNHACNLEDINQDWARQLAIYGWLLGESVGGDFVTMIHQVSCKPVSGSLPTLRFSELTNKIGKTFQQKVFDLACDIWIAVHSDWVFRDRSIEESQAHCQYLETLAKMGSGGDELDQFFFDLSRRKRTW